MKFIPGQFFQDGPYINLRDNCIQNYHQKRGWGGGGECILMDKVIELYDDIPTQMNKVIPICMHLSISSPAP